MIVRFDTLKENFSIPAAEEKTLAFWEENDIFHKANKMAADLPHFVFYEGPPTANGRPGIHHVISRTIKDLVCRYKSMRGFRVDRKGGWDTHGLPVEIEVEKQLKLDSKAKIVEYGIDKFNQQCRKSVFKYLDEWNVITRRIGYWLDLDDAYVTLTNNYIESVWWILKNFYDRDLIYKGYKTIPFCPRCETGLSSHEVAQGYETIKDPSIFVKVKAVDGDFSYLVWTTTPWTLPSNAALCMKADADYVMVEHEGEKLLLAEERVEAVFGEAKEVLEKRKGSDFVNRKYEPLFDFYKDQADKAFYLINAEFVTLDDGTGIVHIAPGFGADDFEIGKKVGLPILHAIEANGIFKDIAGPYKGMFIKDADPVIIKDLKIAGRMFKKEMYEHSYPFCWRCHGPLIYITRQTWYLKTTLFKEQLLKHNNAINWQPDEIRTGRMANWLENNVDWSLSRERFWGTPIPIWICDDDACGKKRAVGSIEQLRKEAVSLPDEVDLHKPMMDKIKLTCECGQSMSRIPEVVDVWFDSGAMPYAQWHYPFENKEEFETKYPADFISEAVDQTRGWFYSLLAISTLLNDKPPFKNVIVIEFILDKEGKKMSKHKGNVIDPFTTVDEFGADPIRWYMMSVSNPWLPTRFDMGGLREVIRKYFDTLRNTYSFFALYANIDDVAGKAAAASLSVSEYLEEKAGEPERFDRWIMSKYSSLVKEVTAGFDSYDITPAVRAIQSFVIEELSNWYVRNNRRRFWAKADDSSKMRSYLTLYHILEGVCRLTAPVSPFFSELLWKELAGQRAGKDGLPISVHMCEFPEADESLIDAELEKRMDLAEKIVSMGRAARSRKNLKVRQPLSQLLVALPEGSAFGELDGFSDIIREELNIKQIRPAEDIDRYVSYSAKLSFKSAGPKLGSAVKEAAAFVSKLDSEAVKRFDVSGQLLFGEVDSKVTLERDDIEVIRSERENYAVESGHGLTVALATELSDELIDEGFAREIVNKVQNMRKTSGFEVTDRIQIEVSGSQRLREAAKKHDRFICSETLADQLMFKDETSFESAVVWNINGEDATIALARV